MLTLLVLALALSMDGLTVAICRGMNTRHRWYNALWTGLVFGTTHALMIALGWMVGDILAAWKSIAPLIAGTVLVLLGSRMLIESRSNTQAITHTKSSESLALKLCGLLMAALATSVDGVAAGITLPLLGLPLITDMMVIGSVTALLAALGYGAGGMLGERWGKGAEFMGGLVLMILGIKVILLP